MTGLIGQHEAFQQGYDAAKKESAELQAKYDALLKEFNEYIELRG